MSEKKTTGRNLNTYFASPERETMDGVMAEVQLLLNEKTLVDMFNAIGVYVLILNEYRQIVIANNEMLSALSLSNCEPLLGARPGEALHCIHSWENEGGCGTSKSCRVCGAVLSILSAFDSKRKTSRECFITVDENGIQTSREFSVIASPLNVADREFVVFSFYDISGEKRKQALEHIFFHDILNIVAGIYGYSRILESTVADEGKQFAARMTFLIQRLREEIISQRVVMEAERDELRVNVEPIHINLFLNQVIDAISASEAAQDKTLTVSYGGEAIELRSDKTLLERVLVNMVKNALEATSSGGEVKLWAEKDDDFCVFYVWNEGYIPENDAVRIFQRSFSTKGTGRGLGTYSVKLLGEKYLGGRVGFKTDKTLGTKFFLSLPLK